MKIKWQHERKFIYELHHAHADYIESTYRGLAKIEGNPFGIELMQMDGVRIFRAGKTNFLNRAIFTGTEADEEIREVLAYIKQTGLGFFVEINPANSTPICLRPGVHPS